MSLAKVRKAEAAAPAKTPSIFVKERTTLSAFDFPLYVTPRENGAKLEFHTGQSMSTLDEAQVAALHESLGVWLAQRGGK
jgi:hypothetical protein